MTSDWLAGAHHHDLSRTRGNGRFNSAHPMRGVVLHVNASGIGSQGTSPEWYVAGGGPDSVCPNFQVMRDGTIWQFLPFNWRPWTQRTGNDWGPSIETGGDPSEPLTTAQIKSCAKILAVYHKDYGIPLRPTDKLSKRGLGTHAMGGAAWGGHPCPGTKRAAQRKALCAAAAAIITAETGKAPVKEPTPAPVTFKPLTDTQAMHELGLTAHQVTNARGIIAAVKDRSWVKRAAYIATETALTESGMRVLASANVPASIKYTHDLLPWTSDGLGHDHASCGMYQQQTGYKYALPGTSTMGNAVGWGTPAELMDPEQSTGKFLDALSHTLWKIGTRWAAAQRVQRSAFSDGSNYKHQDAKARKIVDALWSGPSSKASAPTATSGGVKVPANTTTVVVHSGDTLSAIATAHHTTWQVLEKLNHLANPNAITVGQKLLVPAPAVKTVAKPAPQPTPKPTPSKPAPPKHAAKTKTIVVRPGDTLGGIAAKHHTTWRKLAALNHLKNPNVISVGQRLIVPA